MADSLSALTRDDLRVMLWEWETLKCFSFY